MDEPQAGHRSFDAGGLGVLAGARVSPEQPQEDIQTVKSRTDHPFRVGFLLALPEPGDEEAVATQRFLNRFREELYIQVSAIRICSFAERDSVHPT